jgi:thiol-disulfide isomerase/thioredoxin
MSPFAAIALLAALVLLATALGLLTRLRDGRIRRPGSAARLVPAEVGADRFGERATLLQFSTELCAPCRATNRLLAGTAAGRPGVAHVDVDLTRQPRLADRFRILQTPTTLLLDSTGAVRARIGGVPREAALLSTLDALLEDPHVRRSH